MLKLGLALIVYATTSNIIIYDSSPKLQTTVINNDCKLCLSTKCLDETLACVKIRGCRQLASCIESCGAINNVQCLTECQNKMSHKLYEKSITPATKLVTCTMTDSTCRDVCAK